MEERPVAREETLGLVRAASDVWVKVGPDILRFPPGGCPMSEAMVTAYLVHEDGFMRVPVLARGGLLIRGFTEALYRDALPEGRNS